MAHQIGTTYWTKGLNMRCKPVATRATLLEVRQPDEHGHDCVVRSGGIKILATLASLKATRREALEG